MSRPRPGLRRVRPPTGQPPQSSSRRRPSLRGGVAQRATARHGKRRPAPRRQRAEPDRRSDAHPEAVSGTLRDGAGGRLDAGERLANVRQVEPSPAGVRTMLRLTRRKSLTPKSSSSCLLRWLTTDWLTHNSSAAFRKDRWRAATSKVSRACMGGKRQAIDFSALALTCRSARPATRAWSASRPGYLRYPRSTRCGRTGRSTFSVE